MRQRPIYIIASILIVLFQARTLSAQPKHGHKPHPAQAGEHPSVVLKATVDKQKIFIGQPVQLMLEATVDKDVPLTWPPLDSLAHFDWVEKGKVDSVIRPDGRYYRQYLTVTSFDSGAWAIPRLPFIAGNREYFSDSVRIEVGYSKFDASKDYHDIKDIIDMPNPMAKWFGWIVAAVTIGSLVLVIWLIRKQKSRKQPAAMVVTPRLSPYEEAIRQLEELEKQRPTLSDNGSVKGYYTRLNDIFRQFVQRKLGISSLAETNEELIGEIRHLPVTTEKFPELEETLRMSDFVKFAKYQPGITDHERDLQVIRSSIELLNTIEK
jgi:hypothetical protein